jgi:hypothetical protein
MRASRADSCRYRSAQSEAESGDKAIGSAVIAAPVFRSLVQTEIVGSIAAEASEGESDPVGAGDTDLANRRASAM